MRDELAAQGVAIRPDWVLGGDFTLESGRSCGRAWLAMQDRPTALFCASDEMALGFIAEVQRAGLGVPRDVSVVGFDDIELVAHLTPALTTVHQPRWSIGVEAARVMVALMRGEDPPAPDTILPVELVLRASTAAPPD